jgi:ATP-dependent protease HslVU (ClpYQ) peptidase subunit
MTVLVAVESPEGVVLGCDSFLGGEALRDLHHGPKWRRLGPLVIAGAGQCFPDQALGTLRVDSRPRRREDGRDWIARAVVAPMVERGSWRREGIAAAFLVAYRGAVYEIDETLGVSRSARGYAASGAGYAYAYGALHATEGRPALERVRAALTAACEMSPVCCGPLHVEVFA